MKGTASFWRNAMIVATIHFVVLAGLARWSGNAKTPPLTNVVWVQSTNEASTEASLIAESEAEEQGTPPPIEDPLTMRTPPPREIEEATPKPTSTPRPKPKPTPKKPASTPAPKRERSANEKKITVRTGEKRVVPNESSTTNGGGNSAVVNAKLASYAKVLHDRFEQEWVQPTGLPHGAHYVLAVHLRIERDGRITEFRIDHSSGNVVIDESVEAAGKHVSQVEPLPPELAADGRYDLNVNFELDAK